QAVAALRELVHPAQELHGALQHVGEVEQRSLVQRGLILRERDREHPADAACEHHVEVAAEGAHYPLDRLAEPQRLLPMALARLGARVVVVSIRMNAIRRPWLAVGLEEMRRHTGHEPADR